MVSFTELDRLMKPTVLIFVSFLSIQASALPVVIPNAYHGRVTPCRVDPVRPSTCVIGARRYVVPAIYARDLRLLRYQAFILIDMRHAERM